MIGTLNASNLIEVGLGWLSYVTEPSLIQCLDHNGCILIAKM